MLDYIQNIIPKQKPSQIITFSLASSDTIRHIVYECLYFKFECFLYSQDTTTVLVY